MQRKIYQGFAAYRGRGPEAGICNGRLKCGKE
jgi:hypothetical protein